MTEPTNQPAAGNPFASPQTAASRAPAPASQTSHGPQASDQWLFNAYASIRRWCVSHAIAGLLLGMLLLISGSTAAQAAQDSPEAALRMVILMIVSVLLLLPQILLLFTYAGSIRRFERSRDQQRLQSVLSWEGVYFATALVINVVALAIGVIGVTVL